jgi:hypothetical protein
LLHFGCPPTTTSNCTRTGKAFGSLFANEAPRRKASSWQRLCAPAIQPSAYRPAYSPRDVLFPPT